MFFIIPENNSLGGRNVEFIMVVQPNYVTLFFNIG